MAVNLLQLIKFLLYLINTLFAAGAYMIIHRFKIKNIIRAELRNHPIVKGVKPVPPGFYGVDKFHDICIKMICPDDNFFLCPFG